MKKLLFLGIVVLMVESLGAVTLPSTSYSPYSASTPSDGSFTTTGGTMVTGSFSTLGAGECPPKTTIDCGSCCEAATWSAYSSCIESQCGGLSPDECEAKCTEESGYNACMKDCETDPSLPLDGGLSILLILSLAGGILRSKSTKVQKY
ncbi:MAG: hypothetical protein MJ007_00930 [Paludibacteraceae bacterium]|nr:hypothetical protein [Paludibacteraceae bacterium]